MSCFTKIQDSDAIDNNNSKSGARQVINNKFNELQWGWERGYSGRRRKTHPS